jgi:hypothetical protein
MCQLIECHSITDDVLHPSVGHCSTAWGKGQAHLPTVELGAFQRHNRPFCCNTKSANQSLGLPVVGSNSVGRIEANLCSAKNATSKKKFSAQSKGSLLVRLESFVLLP